MSIYQKWIDAKAAEASAIEARRAIEDELRNTLSVPDALDGTKNYEEEGYNVKVVGRIDRKVDADKLQELAAESGLSDHLSSLFRWTPSINMGAWKAAAENITGPLARAITSKPGRPSFSITKLED